MKLCKCSHWSECPAASVQSDTTLRLCQTDIKFREVFMRQKKNHEVPAGVANKHSETPGTILAQKIAWFSGLKGTSTCGCKNLQAQMDKHGCAWCENNREMIVDKMMANAAQLVTFANIGETVITSSVGRAACRVVANSLLTSAIEKARAEGRKKRAARPRVRRNANRTRSAWRQTGQAQFVSAQQLQTDIKTLVSKIPGDVTAIAGVARSGLSVATMVAMYLHLPILTIRQTMGDVQPTGNGWRLGGNKHIDPKTERVLVVDDTVMTGNSLRAIEPLVKQQFGPNTQTAAVYVNPGAKKKPDIWAVDLGWPHLLEWNLFNSILSPNMATDFDGVICHDCSVGQDDDGAGYLDFIRNAKPLYLSRKVPIPLIVTARIEKYRAETEDWLRRHGVRFDRLVMHPANTLRERMRDDIAAYKARHFGEWARKHKPKPPPVGFIESDDRQARRIASISGRMVICPATAAVYGGGK